MASAFDQFEQIVTPESVPAPPPPVRKQASAFDEFETQPASSPSVGGGEAVNPVSQPPIGGASGSVNRPETAAPAVSAFAGLEPPEETAKWQREIEDRSMFNKPILGAEETTPAEIASIAAKHGVSASELESLAPYFGARIAGSSFASVPEVKRTAGALSSLAMGLPQKLYKMSQSPQMERALDDLQQLAGGRTSYVQNVAEIAAPIGGVASTAGKAAKFGAGAALGAAGGFSGSTQGNELLGTAIGAGAGLVLTGAAEGVSNLLANRAARVRAAATTEAEKAVEEVAQHAGADFQHGVQEAVVRNADADQLIISHVLRDAPELTAEQAHTIANTYSPNRAAQLVSEGVEPTVEAAERRLASDTIRSRANDLASDVLKRPISSQDDAVAIVRQLAGQGEVSGKGTQYLEGRLQGLLNLDTAIEHLNSRGIHETKPQGFAGRALDWLSDAQYVFRGLDEKWKGAGLEDAHKRIVRGVNQLTFPREAMRQHIGNIFRNLRREGLDSEARNAGPIIQAVESGAPMTPQQQAVYSGFRDFFADSLNSLDKLADEAGVPRLAIKQRANYIPAMLADDVDTRFTKRLGAILDDARTVAGQQYPDLASVPKAVFDNVVGTNPEHASTMQFLHTLSGEVPKSPAEISILAKRMFESPTGRSKLETVARAALERQDTIPNWARETNLYKLANKWTTNTLRDLYMREGVDHLRNASKLIRSRGDIAGADYADKLIADLMGTRAGTAAAATNSVSTAYTRRIDRLIEKARTPTQKVALETVRTLPVFLQSLSKEVYSNLLGALNPRTVIMNLTQTLTKTLPEFGGPYGASLFFRGAARIGGLRNLPRVARRMEAMGLAPRRFVSGALDFLDEGLMRSNAAQLGKSAMRKVAEVGMKPYELAETVNRSIAFGASEMMANDLLRGSKLAESSLLRFPTSVRRAVEAARAEGDVGEMVREIATYIVNSTQYQYNRASMSEYGRTMGSLFSAFSKWPTATLGQTVEAYRSKGLLGGTARLGEQLIAPMVLLEGADYLMGQHSDEGLSDRQKKLFGASGLSQAAPLGTLKGIATGDFFTPPVIDTALRTFLDPANAGDSEQAVSKLKRAAENGVYMFAPGGLGGWLRFLTDDMTTLYSGERPEGNTQLERAGLDPFGRDGE